MEDTLDIWNRSAITPFWGRLEQLEELSALVSRCIQTVTKCSSPREMVLETWLVLDYAVRDLVVSGYGLYRFCQEDFDLRYKLLPESFDALLRFVEQTISFQGSLSEEPSPSKEDPYPPYIDITGSYGFLKYLREDHREITESLEELQLQYLAERHPDLAERLAGARHFCRAPKEQRAEKERLPSGWLELVGSLGQDWFSLARRLNRARNQAAHSHDPSTIARAFGIKGPRTVELVRTECLELSESLLGVTRSAAGLAERGEAG